MGRREVGSGADFQDRHYLIRSRGSTEYSRYNNQMLFNIKIVDDAVTANPSAPRARLPLEALYVALKGIVLHRQEGCFNARLIFWRQLLEVLLGGIGDLEIPGH